MRSAREAIARTRARVQSSAELRHQTDKASHAAADAARKWQPDGNGGLEKIQYQSGAKIPESGIYRVRHQEHRLAEEVTLLEGQQFPGCAKCSATVRFELLAAVAESAVKPFRVTLLQIPEIEGGDAA